MNGTYYDSIESVWSSKEEVFGIDDWEELRRTPENVSIISEYGPVIAALDKTNGEPATVAGRSSSHQFKETNDILQEDMPTEVAHMIPHSPTCALAYGPIAELALGQKISQDKDKKWMHQVLVAGVQQTGENCKKNKHINNTGLKHSTLNKVRIYGQKHYLDIRPCMLLLPLMSLDETKAWKSGDGYSALFCIGGLGDGTSKILASNVYSKIVQKIMPFCEDGELQHATDLLTCFTKGLAYSLVNGDCFDCWDPTNKAEKLRLEAVQSALQESQKVFIPVLNTSQNLYVAKVRFEKNDPNMPNPPDPFLLAIKAAVTWSWRNNQKLLPCCGIPEEEECSCCAMMQEYADQLYEDEIRPSNHFKIAQGLGLNVDKGAEFIL